MQALVEARRGIYLSSELGRLFQNPLLAIITPLLGGKKVVFPIPQHDQGMVKYIRQLTDSGQFKPVVDRRYRLEQMLDGRDQGGQEPRSLRRKDPPPASRRTGTRGLQD